MNSIVLAFIDVFCFALTTVVTAVISKKPKIQLSSDLRKKKTRLKNTATISLVLAKYKKGDLVHLNKFGRVLMKQYKNTARIGIIMSNARNYYNADIDSEVIYWVYDVMMGNELINDVPQEFLTRVYKDENAKDNK